MNVKWADLYKDIKGVFKKHFNPEKPEPDGPAVSVIKMIQSIERQQQGVNRVRKDTGELVVMLKDDSVLAEFHRLEAMALSPKADETESTRTEDIMFG